MCAKVSIVADRPNKTTKQNLSIEQTDNCDYIYVWYSI